MNKITLDVYAKVNLTLDILGRYSNGYHELDMVMCSVGIADRISVKRADGISVKMNGKRSGEENIAYRVARECMERYGTGGAEIEIYKGIPFSAGLGGSSADASGVLYALAKLYALGEREQEEVAAAVGSDVAFMLKGGIMRAGGKGEDLKALAFKRIYFVIAKPFSGAATGAVYAEYDKSPKNTRYTENFLTCYPDNECYTAIGNCLQNAAININGQIEGVIRDMSEYTEFCAMSGSGSAVFGIFDSLEKAKNAADKLAAKYPFSVVAESKPCGIEVIESAR